MKLLKFSKDSIPLILSGRKNSTWRLFDDKNLQVEDELMLLDKEGEMFARAVITEIREITFDELAEEDKRERGEFGNDNKMFKVFSKYYKAEVDYKTALKIIRFELLKG